MRTMAVDRAFKNKSHALLFMMPFRPLARRRMMVIEKPRVETSSYSPRTAETSERFRLCVLQKPSKAT